MRKHSEFEVSTSNLSSRQRLRQSCPTPTWEQSCTSCLPTSCATFPSHSKASLQDSTWLSSTYLCYQLVILGNHSDVAHTVTKEQWRILRELCFGFCLQLAFRRVWKPGNLSFVTCTKAKYMLPYIVQNPELFNFSCFITYLICRMCVLEVWSCYRCKSVLITILGSS